MSGPYHATVSLNDGRELGMKWLTPQDSEAVLSFVHDLPEEEVRHLNQDLKDLRAMTARLERLNSDRLRILAAFDPEAGGRMAGYAYLLRGSWASAHRADVECFVHHDYRDLGLGSCLMRHLGAAARAMGLMLLKAEIHVDRKDLITAFKRLGFELKAILEDYRVDRQGRPYDVIILLERLQTTSAQEYLFRY